jgi:hypothetical protein
MTVFASDFQVAIPHFQRSAWYCLAAGILVILGGAGFIFYGKSLGLPELGQFGGGALSSVGLVPFRTFYTSVQKARLLASVKRAQDGGLPLSPAIEATVQRIVGEAGA